MGKAEDTVEEFVGTIEQGELRLSRCNVAMSGGQPVPG